MHGTPTAHQPPPGPHTARTELTGHRHKKHAQQAHNTHSPHAAHWAVCSGDGVQAVCALCLCVGVGLIRRGVRGRLHRTRQHQWGRSVKYQRRSKPQSFHGCSDRIGRCMCTPPNSTPTASPSDMNRCNDVGLSDTCPGAVLSVSPAEHCHQWGQWEGGWIKDQGYKKPVNTPLLSAGALWTNKCAGAQSCRIAYECLFHFPPFHGPQSGSSSLAPLQHWRYCRVKIVCPQGEDGVPRGNDGIAAGQR